VEGSRDYARAFVLRCNTEALLQKRNTEFFSLEYCGAVAIIRGAMAGNKTDRYGHIGNPAANPLGSTFQPPLLGEQ
jgi:hypothetical protein